MKEAARFGPPCGVPEIGVKLGLEVAGVKPRLLLLVIDGDSSCNSI